MKDRLLTASSKLLTDLIEYIPLILFIWIVLFVRFIPQYLRKRKINKLKYEWQWIMKKLKVSKIRERYVGWGEDSSWYYLYRLEAEDENWNIYSSERFKDAGHWWRTMEEMKKTHDGVVYDLSDKDNAIKQLNDKIQRLETELSNNPWFFKKLWLYSDLKTLKDYLNIANEWPITPYLICNGHKISVWDPVDVFVNPDNPKEYYFDLDFTKEN